MIVTYTVVVVFEFHEMKGGRVTVELWAAEARKRRSYWQGFTVGRAWLLSMVTYICIEDMHICLQHIQMDSEIPDNVYIV